jgi:Response regulators consisting of a CheY-like receiver domain and a winged-helix DNA-binding domain
MPFTALVVDDDVKITKILKAYFDREGFVTYLAHDGIEALNQVKEKRPDILILDLMLPSLDGWEICRLVRKENEDVAILMLTARDEEADRLSGLELGADDYVIKPFSPREVVARAKAILRRTQKATTKAEPIKAADLVIDMECHEVRRRNQVIDLTPTEFKLLEVMAAKVNRAYTRLQLVELVQGYAFDGYERTIDAHIKNLRRKIEDTPKEPRYIVTVYGIGYKFASEAHD